jgi:hypothetical protein
MLEAVLFFLQRPLLLLQNLLLCEFLILCLVVGFFEYLDVGLIVFLADLNFDLSLIFISFLVLIAFLPVLFELFL